ncbi:MAG: MBL fold metallo-hydrolase [SAR202 cluster bacterium]|nr:MBL fold metallo-hydrolase [SAR202 cluster bacterium]MDP6511590.1 MBL fold metallo-hydrolase [SAR202 cluster bacterium]MDP6716629.1 MBL fold metallo-hydrolase [SAR202 cluster bacterium]
MSASLTYLGHCAFLLQTEQGRRVVTDPFQNPSDGYYWFLRAFPDTPVDVVAVTHDHFDHNNADALSGNPTILKGPGHFTLDDLKITGALDLHSGNSGRRGMVNTVFVLEINGIRVCHIGDNRHDMPESVREQIGEVDILMVTVDDSSHLLSFEQADQLVAHLSPSVVVPMHYYLPKLTTVESSLGGPDGWLATQDVVKPLNASEIPLNKAMLPNTREVWVFNALLA